MGIPETTPKEVGRARRKANRVGISFKFIPEMKKIFLLLAFAFCATVAFASNGEPVKDTEDKFKLEFKNLAPTESQTEKKGPCILCASCNGTMVCVFCTCGDCSAAFEFLEARLCALGCCSWDE